MSEKSNKFSKEAEQIIQWIVSPEDVKVSPFDPTRIAGARAKFAEWETACGEIFKPAEASLTMEAFNECIDRIIEKTRQAAKNGKNSKFGMMIENIQFNQRQEIILDIIKASQPFSQENLSKVAEKHKDSSVIDSVFVEQPDGSITLTVEAMQDCISGIAMSATKNTPNTNQDQCEAQDLA